MAGVPELIPEQSMRHASENWVVYTVAVLNPLKNEDELFALLDCRNIGTRVMAETDI